ncbi:MAG: hypothetical protein JWN95_1315 [Frankiales bacterium]|nr:hypothetical protein [Frankiales bacterium]
MTHHDPLWDSDGGPLDPFLDDPSDPSDLLDDLDPVEPLTDTDRREIAEDLAELEEFEIALTPHGILGIVVDCGDCGEQHFFSWALMSANLRSLLGNGRTGIHEPAAEPRPESYVTWDYARGFTDALASHHR